MRCLFRPEPAAFALSKFAAHASYNLTSFRDSANGRFRYSHFAPAPCSPPLGGSDGYSAVRFTAAVKYGGRENQLSRRETGYMSGHPRRAHHKLEWARKGQSGIKVLYEHLPRSESSKVIITQSRSYYLLRACKSRFPRSASIYGRVRAMWSRSYYLLRVCKAASRTRLRYMVECGQCGAAHTTCCEAVRHLPAINSDIWLMAGQQPVTKPKSRQKNIFPRLTLVYG